jgi:hypothetical protein
MFPLSSFRTECLRTFGFDGFFHDFLDDSSDLLAFLLPKSYYESKEYDSLVSYLQAAMASHKWRCISTEVRESGEYLTNCYGSRCYQQNLGPHILFHVEYKEDLEVPILPLKPVLANWTIVQIAIDGLRSNDCPIRSHQFLYEAAYPSDFYNTLECLKTTALKMIDE